MVESRGSFDALQIVGNPWDRQPCDTPKSWHAFQLYRDAGYDRSMSHTAEQIGVKTKLLLRWSMRYAWVMRTDAFDKHHDTIKQSLVEQKLRLKFEAEANRTVDVIYKAKTIIEHDLDVLVERAADPEMKDQLLLNSKTMVQMMDRVIMLERIVTGQSTSKTMSESKVDRTERVVKNIVVEDRRPRTIDAESRDVTGDRQQSTTYDEEDEEMVDLPPETAIPPESKVTATGAGGPRRKHS